MGFFSPQRLVGQCCLCHKDILNTSYGLSGLQLKDGSYLCDACVTKFGVTSENNTEAKAKEIRKLFELEKKAHTIEFEPVKKVKRVVWGMPTENSLLEVDELRGLINLPILSVTLFNDIYTDNIRPIDKILNFEYLENGATITDGHGILRACVGGALFGGVGAVVGAVTGQKNSTGICESMKIKVIFDDLENPASYIDILGRQVNGAQKDSAEYEAAFAAAQECMSVLSVLMQRNLDKQGKSVNGTPVRFSVADELLKFKQLLDMGVLTQEEFDKQKKKLLDE